MNPKKSHSNKKECYGQNPLSVILRGYVVPFPLFILKARATMSTYFLLTFRDNLRGVLINNLKWSQSFKHLPKFQRQPPFSICKSNCL